MEPWIEELIARGRLTGFLTFEEMNAASAGHITDPDRLAELAELLEANGIRLIDGDEPDEPSPPDPLPNDLEVGDVLGGHYHRNAEFDKLLRHFGVPFSDCACSFGANDTVFDAELVVPGEQALAAWLALRNLVPVTGLWPVIRDETNGPSFNSEPERLDPATRWAAWQQRFRGGPDTPEPSLTPDVIRADAAAEIVASHKTPPTPWAFRNSLGYGAPPDLTDEPDAPLEPSEPRLAQLFSNAGPFRCHRDAGGADWPIHPFVRLHLYPTATPWEVFAYSPFGGWNAAPWPFEHLAMLRHWHALYGAEVVSLSGDWYELFVPRPPRTRHQALRLAHEMRWFGEDTILGHSPPTADAAVELVRTSHYWYFWWD